MAQLKILLQITCLDRDHHLQHYFVDVLDSVFNMQGIPGIWILHELVNVFFPRSGIKLVSVDIFRWNQLPFRINRIKVYCGNSFEWTLDHTFENNHHFNCRNWQYTDLPNHSLLYYCDPFQCFHSFQQLIVFPLTLIQIQNCSLPQKILIVRSIKSERKPAK